MTFEITDVFLCSSTLKFWNGLSLKQKKAWKLKYSNTQKKDFKNTLKW